MVSEALDGLTDEQLADLELQESGLVSGQNGGAIASTPFARRNEPQPEPAALSDYELNKLEEENYRRVDYVMTPEEFDQYWDRREKEDREVGRFIEGLGQGAAGLVGVVPEAGRELRDAMVGMVTDPVNQVQRNVQTGAEIVRKAGINLVQLYDWVGGKVDDLATSSKRAEAINAGIMDRLIAEGKMTGDRERDMQIYQAALAEARKSGAYTPTAEQVREDRQTAYQRYVREKSLERDYAAVSQFKTGESQMSSPTTAETYQITDERPMETVSQLGAMAIDPVNLIPMGAGALSKARVLRRMAVLSEKPLQGVERAASGLADVAERIETGLSTRIQDITGLTQKQQAALGAGVAGTAVYVDSATESQGGLTKAVMMVGGVLPALHYGGGLLRKVGSAAGGVSTVVREAGVGGLGVARAEAAAGLAGNAAIPERYRKFFTGYVDGTDSTLKRVAQNSDNPEALRRVSRFADRMGATQVARVADDAVSGAVTAGIVGTPFAALQPDAERAGEVMGGILALGAAGGVAGGFARRRSPEVVDADIARMFADVQASGGNVEAFSRLPHQTLDRLSAMQGVLAGKVDFIPLSGDEYRMNADIAQNAGETTAGVFVDKDTNNRARVFINLDAKTKTESIAPHEIGHAILTSDILDGQPRADLRNLVNQQYGPEGVAVRGREYIGRLIDGDARAKTTGEMPMVLTEVEMAAVDGGKTMDDVVADRMKDPAERERLINERFEEFSQRSIDKGQDPLDWARDEIIAETFASEAPAIDFRAIRRDAMFPRLAESMLSAGGRVLEMFGANLSSTGRLLNNPSVLFRDNPLFQDRIMQKRVREYVRSYDQFLAGLEEAGSAAPKGVELARSNNPADLGRSTHVKLRDEGRGVLENDFLFQKPDGTYSFKPQKLINQTEASRAAQIKTLYDARKFVPVNSTEFGKRKVNGRETIGGPVLPPQFDLFTHFPKHVREFARAMEQSRAEGGSWDIDYNAIGTGSSGRYRITNMGAVRAIQRETVPFGWQVTKQNHLLAASLDLNAFRASAMKAINMGELGVFNNDMRQVEADLKTYLGNHRNGLPGEAGIGQAKRDMLNGLIGTGTAVQRTANPLYYELNPRGSIRTWRVDRLNDAKPTGRTGYFFDYDKINNNRMPQALPREAMGMPDAPVRGERADIPLNPRARRAAFISDRGEVRSTGRATHFETNEDLGPDFLAIGAGHLGEDGFFRFGSQTMDDAMGDSPATSAAAAARYNQSLYDQGRRPSAILEAPPGLERTSGRGQTGQAMPDVAPTLQNFDAAQQATGGTLRPIADQPENAPVSGRLTPEQSASIEELQEYYRSVTPQRVKELQADAIESLASRLINKGIPVTEANDMAKATFRTLRSRVNGAMQVISGMGTSDLSRMAGTGRPAVATRKGVNPNWLTSAFEAFDTDNDLALMKAQQVARQLNKEQQAQVAAGQSVDAARASGVRSATIDQGMQFVIGEKTADQKAFGSSLREDPSAPPRVYASVVEGQKFGSQGNYNVFFEWKKDAPMVVTSHHHYGVGNGLTDIHASANIGDKNARSFGDPQTEVYDTLPSGKKVLRTRLLVGNAGAADIRAHQLMVSIPESALSGIKKKGAAGARAELNKIAISQLVGSASQGKTQSFTSKDGVAPMVAIQRNRTEAYVLNPDLKNVASITIVSNSPKETALIKKNLASAFKNNGSPLPRIKVVSAESGPSGNPGRKKITDEFFNLTGKVVYGAALGGAATLAAEESQQ